MDSEALREKARMLRAQADQLDAAANRLDGVLTVEACAAEAGLSKDAIWKAVREGELHNVEPDRAKPIVVTRAEWNAWLCGRDIVGLTVDDLVSTLGVAKNTVTRWATSGQLRARKVRGKWVFHRADVIAFAAAKGLDLEPNS